MPGPSYPAAVRGMGRELEPGRTVVLRWCLPVPVQANPWQPRYLFQELVENGIVFNDGTPEIRVTAEPAGGGSWLFSVEDDGIGFEPRHIPRVTRMFERLHPPGEDDGVGMGLAICQRIAERHGGHLNFETQPGQGTTVRFILPAAEDADPGPTRRTRRS